MQGFTTQDYVFGICLILVGTAIYLIGYYRGYQTCQFDVIKESIEKSIQTVRETNKDVEISIEKLEVYRK
jgi:hypothetical protein